MHFQYILPYLSALLPIIASAPLDTLETRTTCPTTNLVKDPGFESGVTPPTSASSGWVVNTFLGSSTYYLSSPGSTFSGGKYAFTASLYPGPYSPTSGDNLEQTLTTCAGKNYSITADFKFNLTHADSSCTFALVYPFKTTVGSVTTGDGIPGISANVWSKTSAFFQAVGTSSKLSIQFRCNNGQHNLISVDNVVVKLFNGNAY